LDSFLADNPKPTKQELLDYVRANNVQVEEIEKGTREVRLSFETISKPSADEFSFARDSYFDYSDPDEMIENVWEDDSVGYRILEDSNGLFYAFTPSRFDEI